MQMSACLLDLPDDDLLADGAVVEREHCNVKNLRIEKRQESFKSTSIKTLGEISSCIKMTSSHIICI